MWPFQPKASVAVRETAVSNGSLSYSGVSYLSGLAVIILIKYIFFYLPLKLMVKLKQIKLDAISLCFDKLCS